MPLRRPESRAIITVPSLRAALVVSFLTRSMDATQALLAVLLLASPSPAPSPSAPAGDGPVILFLVDNSASLPPLDPEEKRLAALEKMFSFLEGQPYRLILFGGRHEIFVDDVSRYRNNGQWTDFYFPFQTARELMDGYPKGTSFRMILLTDAILDPGPEDWDDMGMPPGQELRSYVVQRTLQLITQLQVPLYVILVGDPPTEGVPAGDREQTPGLILDMVRAANGRLASPTAQSVAAFFGDDGLLLKKFVFRVQPHEGLRKVEPAVRRIVARPRATVELQFFGGMVLPLFLLLFLLLGIFVRSFPGPGDAEVVELAKGVPAHLAVDRLHKVGSAGGWGTTGLSMVPSAKEATATLTYQTPPLDLSAAGFDVEGLDGRTGQLLPLDLEALRRTLETFSDSGSKEEKIYSLNLDYMAKNFDPAQAERLLTTPAAERRRVAALDFLRAKAHLLTNDALRRKLTEARVHLAGYGKAGDRKDLEPGMTVRIGPYRFVVAELLHGGRKDVRLVLRYDRVPSLLGLKMLLPRAFQRTFRLRRSTQRVVG